MTKNEYKKMLSIVIGMFPHLSEKNCGFGRVLPMSPDLPLDIYGFDTRRPIETENSTLSDYEFIYEHRDMFLRSIERAYKMPKSVQCDYVQYRTVLAWLKKSKENIAWDDVLGYLSAIDQRTYENIKTQYNFVLSDVSGGFTIDPTKSFKLTDQLGSSLFTYFRVSYDFKLISLEEVTWNKILDYDDAPFYPSFMHPLVSNLEFDDVLVSRTTRGDIVICDKFGVIATKRRGSWKIFYQKAILRRVFNILKIYSEITYESFANQMVASLFDLSFKRHGALIVFDNNFAFSDKISNPVSILNGAECRGIRKRIGTSIQFIEGFDTDVFAKPRIFTEVASIDGAVILDGNEVYAYNAFIRSECSGSDMGARSTAASAAYELGALPFKVSSDGDTEIIYKNPKTGEKCVMCLA